MTSARELQIVQHRDGTYWIADVLGFIDGPFTTLKQAEAVQAEWIQIEDEEDDDDH